MKPLSLFVVTVFLSLITAVETARAEPLAFTATRLTVGGSPSFVQAADIYGDGSLDLLDDGEITILTNNGCGLFGSNATFNALSFGGFMAAADLRGTGRADLIFARSGNLMDSPSTLVVWTKNGVGGFGSNATLNVGLQPSRVLASDLTGRGKPDLICANWGSETLTVLMNQGDGSFAPGLTLPVGGRPSDVAVADVNGDGYPDLISADDLACTLTVLLNNGCGGFNLGATLTVGARPMCVVAADVNGDGYPDLISANESSDSLTVLTNDGQGGFVLSATIPVGMTPRGVVAADLNGDGYVDLACANFDSSSVMVLTNDGSGHFGLSATIPVDSQPWCVTAADVNGDGRSELICTSGGAGTLTVLTQTLLPAPELAVALDGPNTATLSWSTQSSGFTLETNSDLRTTNWSACAWPVLATNGTNYTATLSPMPAGNLFFRLRQ